MAIEVSSLKHGRVRGRYFRENFAQAGIDLTQIVPELVTSADAAIAAAGRDLGRIQLRIGAADPAFVQAWRSALRGSDCPRSAAGSTSSRTRSLSGCTRRSNGS